MRTCSGDLAVIQSVFHYSSLETIENLICRVESYRGFIRSESRMFLESSIFEAMQAGIS